MHFDARLLAFLAIAVLLRQTARYLRFSHENKVAELEARLAETRLEVLRAQLQPHFLLNSLNTMAELVHTAPDAAELMITRLGDLLRLSLMHAGHDVVPLREELDFTKAYVEVEQIRDDRLAMSWEVAPDTLDAAVPPLICQPVLENAIRHGRTPGTGKAQIHVGSRRKGNELLLWVRDHGPGLPAGGLAVQEHTGLRNTRERLEHLYGHTARFSLTDAPGGGALATFRLPYARCLPAHPPVPPGADGLWGLKR